MVHFNHRDYSRVYPPGRRQILAASFRLSDDPRDRSLNDGVRTATDEGRALPDNRGMEWVVDASDLLWEPVSE